MSYNHMKDLYKARWVLEYKWVYALEKVHGTTSQITYKRVDYPDGTKHFVHFHTGADHEVFVSLFDESDLIERFKAIGHAEVKVVGEHYGGAIMKMMPTYGEQERFIAYEVFVGPHKLDVPSAEKVAEALGLEFVPYAIVPATLEALDAERDRPSELAVRRGCGVKKREGIVVRPPFESRRNNDEYVIAKHRREEYSERKSPPKVIDSEKLAVLTEATAIAEEWVTPMRLTKLLSKLKPPAATVQDTARVVEAVTADVLREGEGEIVDSKAARRAIGTKATQLFHARLKGE